MSTLSTSLDLSTLLLTILKYVLSVGICVCNIDHFVPLKKLSKSAFHQVQDKIQTITDFKQMDIGVKNSLSDLLKKCPVSMQIITCRLVNCSPQILLLMQWACCKKNGVQKSADEMFPLMSFYNAPSS